MSDASAGQFQPGNHPMADFMRLFRRLLRHTPCKSMSDNVIQCRKKRTGFFMIRFPSSPYLFWRAYRAERRKAVYTDPAVPCRFTAGTKSNVTISVNGSSAERKVCTHRAVSGSARCLNHAVPADTARLQRYLLPPLRVICYSAARPLRYNRFVCIQICVYRYVYVYLSAQLFV